MTDLHWLAAAATLTASIWLIYVPERLVRLGLWRTLGNPSVSDPPPAAWAQRAMAAHQNAIENLAPFAGLLLAAHLVGVTGATTLAAATIYFLARLTHLVVYVLGIPVLRTLAFAASWGCQIVLALAILGVI